MSIFRIITVTSGKKKKLLIELKLVLLRKKLGIGRRDRKKTIFFL